MDVVGITNEKKAIITSQAILSMDYLMNSNVVKMCRNLLVNKCMKWYSDLQQKKRLRGSSNVRRRNDRSLDSFCKRLD